MNRPRVSTNLGALYPSVLNELLSEDGFEPGSSQLLQAPASSPWLLALPGSSWLLLAPPGSSLLFLAALPGLLWLLLAPPWLLLPPPCSSRWILIRRV
jgi:hypothetical protein